MPFELRTRLGPGNHVLDGKGQFWGGKGHLIVKYRESEVTCAKTAEWILMPFGLWAWTGPRNHELNGGPDPQWEGAILGKGSPIVKYRDFLPWAVQKRLNWSICCLGYGLGWAEGSTTSIVFTRWCQCVHIGGHIDATWRVWLNCPPAVVMQSHVELLWPLVIGQTIIFLPCDFYLLSSFFSSPNLSSRRLDVYHTSTHGVALVRI